MGLCLVKAVDSADSRERMDLETLKRGVRPQGIASASQVKPERAAIRGWGPGALRGREQWALGPEGVIVAQQD